MHNIGQPHGGAGTLHHVKAGAVCPGNVRNPTVTGYIGHHLDADARKIVPNLPYLAGQVEITQDIYGIRRDTAGVAGTHQTSHGVAGGLITGPLVTLEPF
jgi:hypothetical protein